MTGQVEEFIDEQTHFLLRECSGAFLGLLTQAVEAVDDQHGLRCDGFDELNLLWCVPTVKTSFDDDKRTHPLLLNKQGNHQEIPGAKICSSPGWHAQAIGGENHLLTCGEAGKCRFVEKI